MKTAEAWIQETDKLLPCAGYIREGRIKFYQQIQLDAMKEGMRRATDKIQPLKYRGLFDMRNAILAAAEQLTEKDLT